MRGTIVTGREKQCFLFQKGLERPLLRVIWSAIPASRGLPVANNFSSETEVERLAGKGLCK